MDITITLDRPRWDYILQVLAQRPYAEVATTLTDLASQVQTQSLQNEYAAAGKQTALHPDGDGAYS